MVGRGSPFHSLGAAFDEGLNNRLKRALGVDGVIVLGVAYGSAAEASGLRGARLLPDGGVVAGDLITAVDGKAVDSVGKLFARLDDHRVGETVKLQILRDGRQIELTVNLLPGVSASLVGKCRASASHLVEVVFSIDFHSYYAQYEDRAITIGDAKRRWSIRGGTSISGCGAGAC